MRLLITGAGGYIAQRVIGKLKGICENVVGIDLREPQVKFDGLDFKFVKMDVRSSDLKELVREHRIDTILHLAFVLNPPRRVKEAHDININGTKNVINVCRENGISHLVATTSVAAYGALPDNPVPLKEYHPVRGFRNRGFWYAEDKAEQDLFLQSFMNEGTGTKVTIIRPCIVFGANVKNYISDMVFKPFVMMVPGRETPPLQLIHEDDVAEGIKLILEKRAEGIYNLVGEGTMTLEDAEKIMGKRIIRVSPKLKPALVLFGKLFIDRHLPSAIIDFFIYPWIADGSKAKRELGFSPKYSTIEVFEITYRNYKI